jgi:hypothetical protein
MEGFFNERWGQYWKDSEKEFWRKFDEKTTQSKK